jgi:putative lipoic acid-binding regulatory protein
MNEKPTFADRLSAVHTFPCRYTFKLIGANEPRFERSIGVVLDEIAPSGDPSVSRRASSGGRYVSLTVEVEVPHPEAVIELYDHFSRIDGLSHLL